MAAVGTYGCFELAGSPLQKEPKIASTIDNRGTALVTQAQYRESSPRSTGMARNRRLSTNKPRSESVLVTVLCVLAISEFHDPVD